MTGRVGRNQFFPAALKTQAIATCKPAVIWIDKKSKKRDAVGYGIDLRFSRVQLKAQLRQTGFYLATPAMKRELIVGT